jgi:hypothetical protein
MKVTDADSDADCTTEANEPPALTLGGLVHGVVNSTASIAFSANAMRTGAKLSEVDLEALTRIERAAALVTETVKRFASAAASTPSRPRSGIDRRPLRGLL